MFLELFCFCITLSQAAPDRKREIFLPLHLKPTGAGSGMLCGLMLKPALSESLLTAIGPAGEKRGEG